MGGEFNVSRPTARAALRLLGERGLITTVRGKGSCVVERSSAEDAEGDCSSTP